VTALGKWVRAALSAVRRESTWIDWVWAAGGQRHGRVRFQLVGLPLFSWEPTPSESLSKPSRYQTERAELAAKLLASLDEGSDADAEDAWAAEITQRAESVLRGQAKLVSWEDVDAEAAQIVTR
jgi:putative addiction module component (TIGR02574 family)